MEDNLKKDRNGKQPKKNGRQPKQNRRHLKKIEKNDLTKFEDNLNKNSKKN
jgi:hypothetical protein